MKRLLAVLGIAVKANKNQTDEPGEVIRPNWHSSRIKSLVFIGSFLAAALPSIGQELPDPPPPPETTFVITDKSDYLPGSTANITGLGFQPGETVALQVLHADGRPSDGEDHEPWPVVADESGAFQSTWHVCEDDC